jgi:hypothetical protein
MSFDFEIESTKIFLEHFNKKYHFDFQINLENRKIDDDVDVTAESKNLNRKIYIQVTRAQAENIKWGHFNSVAYKKGERGKVCELNLVEAVKSAMEKKAASYPVARQQELILLIVDEFPFAGNQEVTSERLFNRLPENNFKAVYLISRPQSSGEKYVLLLQRTDLLDDLKNERREDNQ